MAQARFRRIPFRFDDDIAFHFNPINPGVSHAVNQMSLLAPSFERYFVGVIREAMPAIRDERVRADAEVFCRQEAQHARMHSDHLRLLTRRHPGLEVTRRRIAESYDALRAAHSRDFHLAYAATIELLFGPLSRFIVENRDVLFRGGDPRISSFVLWHFVEEFEHRNCAIDVFDDLVGSHAFRLRNVGRILGHMRDVTAMAQRGLDSLADQGIEPSPKASPVAGVPIANRLRAGLELASTLLPNHRPDRLREPEWVARWLADEASGCDMRRYYPSVADA